MCACSHTSMHSSAFYMRGVLYTHELELGMTTGNEPK